ncbi:MAG: AAA family ATPase, partial [Bilophila sp.]
VKLGFEKEHPLRIQAGTLYTLLKLVDEGHVYYPRQELVTQTCTQLDVAAEQVETALDDLAQEERVVLEQLDDQVGVYISRFHHYESKIAFYLHRILASPKSVSFPDPDGLVDTVVAGLGIELAEEQLNAVRTASKSKMMVLTGGPGTGKTTILNAIIRVFAERKAKILLAAPTGRAAKRMSEASGREARTLHRLLEYSPQEDGFVRNEDNPLACGLLVVDEASMMDTMLAYHLLKATPLGATVVFVGDIHQLPSVGPGNVLRDLIASGAMPVVELVEVFRQAAASEIICNAHLINKGEIPHLESSRDRLSDFYFMRQQDPERVVDTIVDLVKNHIPRRFGLDAVNDIQVLAPMHRGTVGAANLNQRLQEALNPSGEALQRGERFFRLGDKVMQIRNNYEKDIYNGDIGRISLVNSKEKCLVVRFDDRPVSYKWEELDEIVAAYAISIHKSQGSEYPAVVIPLMTQHYMLLQRNLIYTGVTRGKRLVVLVGESRALAMAVNNNRM